MIYVTQNIFGQWISDLLQLQSKNSSKAKILNVYVFGLGAMNMIFIHFKGCIYVLKPSYEKYDEEMISFATQSKLL